MINRLKNKSFQLLIKTKVATVAKPLFDIGKIIFQKICTRLHPSIFAASSSSFGIDSIKGVKIKMLNARFVTIKANIIPILVFNIPILRNIRINGIIIAFYRYHNSQRIIVINLSSLFNSCNDIRCHCACNRNSCHTANCINNSI